MVSGGKVGSLHFPKKKCTLEKAVRVNQQGKMVLGKNTVKEALEWDKVNEGRLPKEVSMDIEIIIMPTVTIY